MEKKSITTSILDDALGIYEGPWDFHHAAHLLRRTTIGCRLESIQLSVELGLEATIEQLFELVPLPDPPLKYDDTDDPTVSLGQTWINTPYAPETNSWFARTRSLKAWTIETILKEDFSIREQLTLFWHNHFAVSDITDPKFLYKYITTLRTNAWGNFKDLVQLITIDPAMLCFLNGNQNVASAPNENFARELLELYTIGKGPLAGPGDYTTYTEQDVEAIARILTGWQDQGFLSTNEEAVTSIFNSDLHDGGTKVLSHRFDLATIPDLGEEEYRFLINLIFQKRAVAQFICRKLYRWIVSCEIDAQIEIEIIDPLADVFIEQAYEIKPVLQVLLSSKHFFDIQNQGRLIKNPIEYMITPLKQWSVNFPEDLTDRYSICCFLYFRAVEMGMDYYFPPNVAGWKAFYQAPLFNRVWINSTTLGYRINYMRAITNVGYTINSYRLKIDPLPLIAQLSNPYDPDDLIEELTFALFPQPLTIEQKNTLKEILLPGLPDFEWTLEYENYLNHPDSEEVVQAIVNKINLMLSTMLKMEEYFLN